jgi:hypothetical protein
VKKPFVKGAAALLMAAASMTGCRGAEGLDEEASIKFPPLEEPVLVAEAAAWGPAPASVDPQPEHRPEDAVCEVGFALEYGTFEIDTGLCTYGLFEQPSMHDVPEGTEVRIIVVHDQLYAPEPSSAHILMSIGGSIAFEARVDVPGPYGLLEEIWVADRDIPEGTPLRLHLHNHGVNSWRILDIRTL